MTPDHDLGMHGDGHPKLPVEGENALLSPGTERIGGGAEGRILVVAPQPFYEDWKVRSSWARYVKHLARWDSILAGYKGKLVS